jgi:hypothetical protein
MFSFLTKPVHYNKLSLSASSLSYLLIRRFFLSLSILWIAAVVASCAASRQALSPVAMKAQKIELELKNLAKLYEKRDESQFFSSLHPLFKESSFSKESIQHDFKTFSEIKIGMEPTQVEITKEGVFIEVYWEGAWATNSVSSPLRQSGHALFIFSAEDPHRLLEIRGESPFGLFQKKE